MHDITLSETELVCGGIGPVAIILIIAGLGTTVSCSVKITSPSGTTVEASGSISTARAQEAAREAEAQRNGKKPQGPGAPKPNAIDVFGTSDFGGFDMTAVFVNFAGGPGGGDMGLLPSSASPI